MPKASHPVAPARGQQPALLHLKLPLPPLLWHFKLRLGRGWVQAVLEGGSQREDSSGGGRCWAAAQRRVQQQQPLGQQQPDQAAAEAAQLSMAGSPAGPRPCATLATPLPPAGRGRECRCFLPAARWIARRPFLVAAAFPASSRPSPPAGVVHGIMEARAADASLSGPAGLHRRGRKCGPQAAPGQAVSAGRRATAARVHNRAPAISPRFGRSVDPKASSSPVTPGTTVPLTSHTAVGQGWVAGSAGGRQQRQYSGGHRHRQRHGIRQLTATTHPLRGCLQDLHDGLHLPIQGCISRHDADALCLQ